MEQLAQRGHIVTLGAKAHPLPVESLVMKVTGQSKQEVVKVVIDELEEHHGSDLVRLTSWPSRCRPPGR